MAVHVESPQERAADERSPDAGEREFVNRFLAGDRAAFARLAALHEARIGRLAWRLLGWRGEVEDVVQEVFVKCLENLPRFRGESSFATWLTTLTINECRRRRRRLGYWLNFFRASPQPEGPHSPADALALLGERSLRVQAAIRALPAGYREVIVLRYLEEMEVVRLGRVA